MKDISNVCWLHRLLTFVLNIKVFLFISATATGAQNKKKMKSYSRRVGKHLMCVLDLRCHLHVSTSSCLCCFSNLVLEKFYLIILIKNMRHLDFFFRCERRTTERLSDSRAELVDLFVWKWSQWYLGRWNGKELIAKNRISVINFYVNLKYLSCIAPPQGLEANCLILLLCKRHL